MSADSSRPTGHHDPVELPVIDLDADAPPGEVEPSDAGRSSASRRWQWVAVAAVFVVGALAGAYVTSMRAEADTAEGLRFGGYDFRDWSGPGEPVSLAARILNTGDREVEIVGMSVPGLADEELGVLADEAFPVPPDEWAVVPVVRHLECTADTSALTDGDSSSISVTTGVDGRITETELSSPAFVTQVADILRMACEEQQSLVSYLEMFAAEIGEPQDGQLPIRMEVVDSGGGSDDVTVELDAISSTAAGFTVTSDDLPFPLDTRRGSEAVIEVTWEVHCPSIGSLVDEFSLNAELSTSDGVTETSSVWLRDDVVFALGELATRTCSGADIGS